MKIKFVKTIMVFGISLIGLFSGSNCILEPMQSSANTTSHYAGTDCLASGCHDSGENVLTIAGTLYSSAAGTTAVTGGIVTVSNGTDTIDIESDLAGNFYTSDSRFANGTLADASAPGGMMVSTTSLPSGCNSCHSTSGSTSPVF